MSEPLDLGCFSVSLNVADLQRSIDFYEKLGFEVLGGEGDYRILGNGPTKIGVFQGVIPENVLTFNPGLAQEWDEGDGATEAAGPSGEAGMPGQLDDFTDIREIERRLLDAGIELTRRTETGSGADHLTITDPDGNQILIDQFF
jgi:catechol 2,3-dioxygenase-like lactoylglutathione lyase family enzyme